MDRQTNKKIPYLSNLDRKILNIIQKDFPISSHPFQKVASMLDSTEKEVFSRVQALKEKGVIRRLGGVFDSKKMGFVSTLVALKVPPGKIEEVGRKVSALAGVTHNYQREHSFNLWFTLVAASEKELQASLALVNSYPAVEKLRQLPALHFFKISVNFSL